MDCPAPDYTWPEGFVLAIQFALTLGGIIVLACMVLVVLWATLSIWNDR